MQGAGQTVEIRGLTRRFWAVVALDGVSLAVEAGEFLALLGPSGSGKTTVLMAIAGFERPDGGSVLVGGRAIDRLPPHRRDIGMVFQRYALFPHLTVAENVAYPLRRRGVGPAEISRRVGDALGMVRLDGFGSRGVGQLSGGQQQRVAVARALIARPGVLLMDEPMSALDKKLRQHMQMELKMLHRELGTTVILVTHDQEEALSMADRVAVLEGGRIRQVGTPDQLYREPVDAFVADFIGQTNFLPLSPDLPHRVEGFDAPLGPALADVPPTLPARRIGVRPEHVGLEPRDAAGQPCTVLETSFGGATQLVLVAVGGHRVTAELPASGHLWRPGETASLTFRPASCRVFEPSHQPYTSRRDADAA